MNHDDTDDSRRIDWLGPTEALDAIRREVRNLRYMLWAPSLVVIVWFLMWFYDRWRLLL